MDYSIRAKAKYGFYLLLNPMMSNAESRMEFGPFPTREAARAFYDAEAVELYHESGADTFSTVGSTEKKYHKFFRKDGPLEWCNPLHESEWNTPGLFGHGLHEVILDVYDIERVHPL